MGYQVGFQCFDTKEAATNYLLSQVPPTVTNNGLLKPIFFNGKWTYEGEAINYGFPMCSAEADFKAGVEISASFVTLCFVAYCVRLVIGMLRMSYKGEKDD